MAKVDVENVLSGCRSELNDRIERVFGEFDPTPRMKRSLVTLVGELIQSDAPTPSHSGLVIAGFGEKEFFPTLVAVSVEGVVGGKLKYDRRLQVDIARDGDPATIVPFAQGEMVTRFMEGIDPTFLVSCPASFWCFRVRHARQCKAWSAGNIGHIGKDHNAAVARMANSRRARPTGPVAALRPLAMGPPFPAGTRLATDPVGRAEIPETCGTRHLVVEHTCNDVSVVAGVFLARRGREVVPGYVEWAQRGEGRTGGHPKGAPTNAHPRCWHLLTYARYAFKVPPSGLDACGRADTSFQGCSTTRVPREHHGRSINPGGHGGAQEIWHRVHRRSGAGSA